MFSGAIKAVCSNGMIIGDSVVAQRLKHVQEPEIISRILDRSISKLLSMYDEGMSQIEGLKYQKLTKDEAEHVIQNLLPFPKYIRELVWKRLIAKSKQTDNGKSDWDGTMYGVYMAATYVATHANPRSSHGRVGLSPKEYQELSDVRTFSIDWDKREKELEQLEAAKLKVAPKARK